MNDIDDYLALMSDRHIGILAPEVQQTLSDAVICGAGVGGVGGQTVVALARLGCRRFRIADGSTFEPTNANRQAGCTIDTVARNKAEVVAEMVQQINPQAEVAVCPQHLTPDSVTGFVRGGSIVIDAIDLEGLEVKRDLFDASRREGLTVLTCPVFGFGTALGIFHPEQSPGFEEYFGVIPDREDVDAFAEYRMQLGPRLFGFQPTLDYETCARRIQENRPPTTGVSCLLSAALTTTAVIDQLSGEDRFPLVPTTIHIDLMEQRVETIRRGSWTAW